MAALVAIRLIQASMISLGDVPLLPDLNDWLQLFDDEHPPADFVLAAIAVEGRTTWAKSPLVRWRSAVVRRARPC